MGVSSPIVARGPAHPIAQARASRALAAYTSLTLYPVLHWSEYTGLLLLTDPFVDPMHKLFVR